MTSELRAGGQAAGSPARIRHARNSVAVVFLLAGLVIATWLSRIPQVREHLALTPGELGRVLLGLAAGSVLALPTAGMVVSRVGARRTVAGAVVLAGAGLVLAGLGGGPLASAPVVVAGLFVVGYGAGVWDVAMNVEGAAVERQLRRTIMPRLHAGFSLGTVAGAGAGALAAVLQVPVAVHLSVVGAVVTVVGVAATRGFPPATAPQPDRAGVADRPFRVRDAWQEPRTVLIGVLVLVFALSEGVAYDWLAVALVDGLGATNAVGAVGLAVFVAGMTATRTFGTTLLDRHGRVRVLRTSAVLAAGGVLLVVFGGSLPVALAGALLWGAGTALGFPVGMSAGADDGPRAAMRVSVVASIAYTAFLAGPPLLGWLGDRTGVHRALLVVLVVLAVGALVARATRPLSPAAADPGE